MDLEAFWLLSDRPFLAAPLRTLGLLPSLTKSGHPNASPRLDKSTYLSHLHIMIIAIDGTLASGKGTIARAVAAAFGLPYICLLYTSPSPRDRTRSRMPSSA